MNNIFEEIMKESRAQLNESVRRIRKRDKKVENMKFPLNKLKVESRRVFEDEDFDNSEFDIEDEVSVDDGKVDDDEVVLVIDPEISANDEVPEDAAESMVGDLVYKCPVCGSNYVCDCDPTKNEGIEVDDEGVPTECPICGDESEQILIGEISPAEEAKPEDSEELEPQKVEDEVDTEVDEEEIPEDEDEDFEEESLKAEGSVIKEDIDDEKVTEDEDEDFEEEEEPLDLEVDIPEESVVEEKEETPSIEIKDSDVELVFDDSRFESMMTKLIRENYKGTPLFKASKIVATGNQLKVEYVVRDGKKVSRGTLIGEGYDPSARVMTINFKDQGVFTEALTDTPSFIIECVRLKSVVRPTSVKYDYKVKVNESLYQVKGSVGLK